MPKVLIDITDEQCRVLMEQINKCAKEEDFCLSSTEIYNTAYLFLSTIEKGIVIDNLTNGEVIQKMFPKVEYIGENTHAIYLSYGGDESEIIALELNWWNRKWGE